MGLFDKLNDKINDKFHVDKLKQEGENIIDSIKNKDVGSLFDSLKNIKDINKEDENLEIEEFYVAGVSYYTDNIMKLAVTNKEYRHRASTIIENGYAGRKVFKYTFVNKPVKLVPEPKNPHDKNAIQVLVAGKLVGYVPADECTHIKNIMKKHKIKHIISAIRGGEYKIVALSGDVQKLEYSLSIKITIAYV